MNIRRKRVIALVNSWSKIISENITTREQAIEILKKSYEETGAEPIRGSSVSPDLFDKDMASLYIVGKWGLGIDKELSKEVLEKIFSIEIAVEKIIDSLRKTTSYEDFCREFEEICKNLDERLVARMLRYAFTLYYFGFIDRQEFFDILRKTYTVLKPLEETVKRFTKFVIAYEVSRKISENEIKNRTNLNMIKNLVALDIGIPHTVPTTKYIIDVAQHFFELSQDLINNLKSENK